MSEYSIPDFLNAYIECKRIEIPLSLSVYDAKRWLEACAIASKHDVERAHGDADNILCAVLRELMQSEVVAAWKQVKKWYA